MLQYMVHLSENFSPLTMEPIKNSSLLSKTGTCEEKWSVMQRLVNHQHLLRLCKEMERIPTH